MKRIFDMAPNHLRRESQINNILGGLKARSGLTASAADALSETPNNGGKRGTIGSLLRPSTVNYQFTTTWSITTVARVCNNLSLQICRVRRYCICPTAQARTDLQHGQKFWDQSDGSRCRSISLFNTFFSLWGRMGNQMIIKNLTNCSTFLRQDESH